MYTICVVHNRQATVHGAAADLRVPVPGLLQSWVPPFMSVASTTLLWTIFLTFELRVFVISGTIAQVRACVAEASQRCSCGLFGGALTASLSVIAHPALAQIVTQACCRQPKGLPACSCLGMPEHDGDVNAKLLLSAVLPADLVLPGAVVLCAPWAGLHQGQHHAEHQARFRQPLRLPVPGLSHSHRGPDGSPGSRAVRTFAPTGSALNCLFVPSVKCPTCCSHTA